MNAACCGLEISQSPCSPLSSVFESDSGGAAYALDISIQNVSDRILRPQGPQLEIPWHETHFHWLENPFQKVPREYTYSHPFYGPAGWDPEAVLNHRLGPRCILYPGACLEGLLLGVGEASIPDRYVDRQDVWVSLSIFDQRGNCYTSDVKLLVTRQGQLRRRQEKESRCNKRELFGKHLQSGAARTQKVAA